VAARWARAPSSRRSVRSPTTTFRPVTKRWPSTPRAASTLDRRDGLRPALGKAAIAACHRAMARHGRIVPIQAQVTIELTGRMLPGPRSAPPSPLSVHSAWTCSASTARPVPSRCTNRCATSRILTDRAIVLAQRGATERRRGQDALRPHAGRLDRTPHEVRHRIRVQVVGAVVARRRNTWLGSSRLFVRSRRHTDPILEPAVASIYSATNYQQTARCARRRTDQRERLEKFRDAMLEGDGTRAWASAETRSKGSAHPRRLC